MIPQRMCAVCRQRREKSELLRTVKNSGGEIKVDRENKLPGRGAYICKSGDCVKNAARKRALERTFSCKVDGAVYEELIEMSDLKK